MYSYSLTNPSPAHSTHLCQSVPQVLDESIDGDIHPKYSALSIGASVDDGDVNGSALALWEGQRDADVGVKGARAGVAGGANDGGTKLPLEEILDKRVVALHVTDECFRGNVLVGSTGTVLFEKSKNDYVIITSYSYGYIIQSNA